LFSAIRLLVNPETCILYNEKARILLEKFINDNAILYESEFITYYVHNLINLSYFVQKHGPLDSFSAFRYENYLKELKKSMKCAKYLLQVVSNRIIEKYKQINSSTASQIKYPLFQKEKLNKNYSYNVSEIAYERVILHENCLLNINSVYNKCVMLKNGDMVIINNSIKCNVQKMLNVSEVFNLSNFNLSSRDIGFFVVDFDFLSTDQLSNTVVFLNDFKCKCFCLQLSVCKAVIITLSYDF